MTMYKQDKITQWFLEGIKSFPKLKPGMRREAHFNYTRHSPFIYYKIDITRSTGTEIEITLQCTK